MPLLSSQFIRFCIVGAIGFVVDAGLLQIFVTALRAGPYRARIVSFLAAASVTWAINRRYTFAASRRATHREWARYTAFMALGALVNYLVFALCISGSDTLHKQPWLAVAFGSLAALFVNFTTSRRFVFAGGQDVAAETDSAGRSSLR